MQTSLGSFPARTAHRHGRAQACRGLYIRTVVAAGELYCWRCELSNTVWIYSGAVRTYLKMSRALGNTEQVLHEPRCRQNRDDRQACDEGRSSSTMPRSATPRARDFAATRRALILRAVCFVVLLAKGMTIRCVARLASHPRKTERAAMRDLFSVS